MLLKYINTSKLFLALSLIPLCFACKRNNQNGEVVKNNEITITVKSDEHIKIKTNNTFNIKKGLKWKDVKSIAENKINTIDKNFEIDLWYLEDSQNILLDDFYTFNKNDTVFATSRQKEKRIVYYKVEHWQQNIDDDEYTKKDEEEKNGEAEENTDAIAKTYEGFTAKNIIQEKIKADGSTIVKIKYDRNITSIIINLDGGKTNTPLENGEGGKHLLRGKFGAEVKIESPTKENFFFAIWEPNLPNTFPAQNDGKVYTAKWEIPNSFVFITGDERVDISENIKLALQIDSSTTFSNIKIQVEAKIRLKNEWNNGYYGIFEWRENDENGKLIEDTTQIIQGMKIYAITNYIKFKIEGTKLSGYQVKKPRGKIIIPKEITEIGPQAFEKCEDISNIDFSRSKNLFIIGEKAFFHCYSLTNLNLSTSQNIQIIKKEAFYHCKNLKNIDLSTSEIVVIGREAFAWCENLKNVNLLSCTSLNTIEAMAFYKCTSLKTLNLSRCENLTTIEHSTFYSCSSLENLDLSHCTKLKKIKESVFYSCNSLKAVNLENLIELEEIMESAFRNCPKLKTIDLSHCTNLRSIKQYVFHESKNAIVKLPSNIEKMEKFTFGDKTETYCKEVIVPNEQVKAKVITTLYPENRIKVE